MSQALILIPSFNEKSSLLKILKKIRHDTLIMDDCSTDGTLQAVKRLKKKNLRIIFNKKNYGYEKNLLRGFKEINKKKYQYVITFDADGEHNTNDINRMERYLKLNKVDLLIGTRKKTNRFVENIVSFFFKIFFKVKDPLSGFKAYKINNLKRIIYQIKYNFFLVDIIKIFKTKNYKIKCIDIRSKISKKRIPRIGNNFFIKLKILKCISLIF